MVGIYAKIKNGLNWIQNKALKNILPIVGKVGDVANSDLLNSILGYATPVLNSLAPNLGTGLQTVVNYAGKLGNIANNAYADYQQNPFTMTDFAKNVASGKYGGIKAGAKAKPKRNVVF
jgi:hypothetical protein